MGRWRWGEVFGSRFSVLGSRLMGSEGEADEDEDEDENENENENEVKGRRGREGL